MFPMDIGDIPLFSMLRGRMGYLSERQKLIGKSVLMKASEDQLDTILKRMKALGLDETIKRLA